MVNNNDILHFNNALPFTKHLHSYYLLGFLITCWAWIISPLSHMGKVEDRDGITWEGLVKSPVPHHTAKTWCWQDWHLITAIQGRKLIPFFLFQVWSVLPALSPILSYKLPQGHPPLCDCISFLVTCFTLRASNVTSNSRNSWGWLGA